MHQDPHLQAKHSLLELPAAHHLHHLRVPAHQQPSARAPATPNSQQGQRCRLTRRHNVWARLQWNSGAAVPGHLLLHLPHLVLHACLLRSGTASADYATFTAVRLAADWLSNGGGRRSAQPATRPARWVCASQLQPARPRQRSRARSDPGHLQLKASTAVRGLAGAVWPRGQLRGWRRRASGSSRNLVLACVRQERVHGSHLRASRCLCMTGSF